MRGPRTEGLVTAVAGRYWGDIETVARSYEVAGQLDKAYRLYTLVWSKTQLVVGDGPRARDNGLPVGEPAPVHDDFEAAASHPRRLVLAYGGPASMDPAHPATEHLRGLWQQMRTNTVSGGPNSPQELAAVAIIQQRSAPLTIDVVGQKAGSRPTATIEWVEFELGHLFRSLVDGVPLCDGAREPRIIGGVPLWLETGYLPPELYAHIFSKVDQAASEFPLGSVESEKLNRLRTSLAGPESVTAHGARDVYTRSGWRLPMRAAGSHE